MPGKTRFHHRRSVRLKDYDYSSEGVYFVTVCTKGRQCFFGKVIGGKMQLNEIGKIVKSVWMETSIKRSNIKLDVFVIMPNHIHGIIVINCRGELNSPVINTRFANGGRMQYAPTNKFRSPKQSLGSIVRGFKSAVTNRVRQLMNDSSFSVWQRNYYEHIIRNEYDLDEIRRYIVNNPAKWKIDKYYSNQRD